MRLRLQFFSRLRELAGASEIEMEMPPNSTVADLLTALYAQAPKLRDWDQSILVAAGLEFVDRNYVLQPNDEMSIMPPVQGG